MYENGRQIYDLRSAQVSELMRSNPVFFDEIFVEILPDAVVCDNNFECIASIRSRLDLLATSFASASATVSVPGYFSSVDLANTQPMYFIVLDENQIIKLFFSGETTITPVNSKKKHLVANMLLGKRSKLYGVQANVDGLRMTYLNDLYSEAEVIVPYVKNGGILGAVVYLHGD